MSERILKAIGAAAAAEAAGARRRWRLLSAAGPTLIALSTQISAISGSDRIRMADRYQEADAARGGGGWEAGGGTWQASRRREQGGGDGEAGGGRGAELGHGRWETGGGRWEMGGGRWEMGGGRRHAAACSRRETGGGCRVGKSSSDDSDRMPPHLVINK